ncbi:cytochrome-c peroxidase [Geoalkalibacter halelectricus]|uniref:cytochrome-c peroxidase n=1 Tax=Geoalkalibacter halelectricus TaxID=2847045 RepID=UPI003D21F3AB
MLTRSISLALLLWGIILCGPIQAAGLELPEPLPLLQPPPAKRVELGRMLFFDRRLSGDGTMSCAVCHDPQRGYADGRALSGAYPTTRHWRHTQSLINVAYLDVFLWDGRSTSLEEQAEGPIHSSFEMNLHLDFLVEKLRETPGYPELFHAAYQSEITRQTISAALADFQRSLIVRDTPFDAFLAGDSDALSSDARRGLELFYGKAACSRCHSGPLLSDQKFHNTGVGETEELLSDPQRRAARNFFLVQVGLERGERDPGRYVVTRDPADLGAFRTPPLRQVAETAPYMHNGSLATLEEVIAFYNRGGGSDPDKSPLLRPLELTAEEKSALLAFLHSLTGTVPVVRPPALP